MPRVVSGTAPSATVFNTLAAEVDALGAGCTVRRTSTQTGILTGTDFVVSWQALTFDTIGGMWSASTPTAVTIVIPGVYACTLQERWSPSGGNGTGQRAGKIMLNGSSVFNNSQASDKRAADGTAEGVTLSMTTVLRLVAGDQLYCNYWQSSGSTISGLHTDYGGTFFSVNRMGPLTV